MKKKKKNKLIRKIKKFIWFIHALVLVSVVLYGVWVCKGKKNDVYLGESN